MTYSVLLKVPRLTHTVQADKMCCEDNGWTVFYSRPDPGKPFEEVTRLQTRNISKIEEMK